LKEDFDEMPEIVMEPGRSLVAGAGIIVTEVIMVAKKSKVNGNTWVYLDIGKFGGLIETMDESIRYPIFTESGNAENNVRPVILAGPTCDSMDILYEKNKYSLPRSIKEGDRLYIMTTGAYTSSYSSSCFNGIPPLRTYVLQEVAEARTVAKN
jgi:ornithine decarboxylase